CDALVQLFFLVVSTLFYFFSLRDALTEFFFWDIKRHDTIDCHAATCHECIQCLCLRYGAWETVEQEACGIRRLVNLFFQHSNGYFIRHKRAARHNVVNLLAEWRVVACMPAEEVTRRDVNQSVFLDELLALCALTRSGRAENDHVQHDNRFDCK